MGVLPSEFNRQSDRITRNKGRRRADSFFAVGATGGTTSGTTEHTIFTINIPSQPGPYLLKTFIHLTLSQSTGTEQFDILLHLDGAASFRNYRISHTSTTNESEDFVDITQINTFFAHTLTIGIARIAGAGTATIISDVRFSRAVCLIEPR